MSRNSVLLSRSCTCRSGVAAMCRRVQRRGGVAFKWSEGAAIARNGKQEFGARAPAASQRRRGGARVCVCRWCGVALKWAEVAGRSRSTVSRGTQCSRRARPHLQLARVYGHKRGAVCVFTGVGVVLWLQAVWRRARVCTGVAASRLRVEAAPRNSISSTFKLARMRRGGGADTQQCDTHANGVLAVPHNNNTQHLS
jgi:hypothetical protein